MNLKLVALGGTGALTATGATVAYLYLSSSKTRVIEGGKTLKQKYPDLKIEKYNFGQSGEYVDNSFWWERTQKLKNYKKEGVWTLLLKSIKESATEAQYIVEDNYFNLGTTESSTFDAGDAEIAKILFKYCTFNLDKENKEIENYPDILKDLCT